MNDKLYAAGGRKTSGVIKQVFNLTIPEVDVFDISNAKWSTLPSPQGNLPTPSAGCFAFTSRGQLLIAGGESTTQNEAHNQVEALDPATGLWHLHSRFSIGRHGTGIAQWKDTDLLIAKRFAISETCWQGKISMPF
ncbi:MAG: hypothetical protein SGI77_19115 [Pirellulaceae bacterium]|nr:hypothetical protein [Pirellulaceae bacterium]